MTLTKMNYYFLKGKPYGDKRVRLCKILKCAMLRVDDDFLIYLFENKTSFTSLTKYQSCFKAREFRMLLIFNSECFKNSL